MYKYPDFKFAFSRAFYLVNCSFIILYSVLKISEDRKEYCTYMPSYNAKVNLY